MQVIHQLNINMQVIHQLNINMQVIHQLNNNMQVIHQLNNNMQVIHQLNINMQVIHQLNNRSEYFSVKLNFRKTSRKAVIVWKSMFSHSSTIAKTFVVIHGLVSRTGANLYVLIVTRFAIFRSSSLAEYTFF